MDDNNLYNKEMLKDEYNNHIDYVKRYFRFRPKDLLVINLKEKDSYSEFCKFLNIKQSKDSFPWENKTDGNRKDIR